MAMDTARNGIRISVVVPFYNAERHIGDCVHSLMRQTLSVGIEFIFVNDCSTDASEAVLQAVVASYPQRREQVTTLRNAENRGSAYSRQRGVDAARGEFVIHCDADDWVDSEMYGRMLRVADSTGADVVCTPFFLEKGEGRRDTVAFPSLDYPQLNAMPLDTLHCSLCNKIVRRRVIVDNGIRFFEGVNCWEDLGLWFRVAIATRRIVIYNRPFYHYRKETADSLSTKRMDRVLSDHLAFVARMDEWFASQPAALAERYGQFVLFARFTAKIKMLRGRDRDVVRWRSTYPETNARIWGYGNIPWLYRLCFLLVDRLPLWMVKMVIAVAKLLRI